jgi:hypothetical protein
MESVAFAGGKRLVLDPEADVAVIQGEMHTDRMRVADIAARVALYRRLYARRPGFYADSLAAATRLAEMRAAMAGDGADA